MSADPAGGSVSHRVFPPLNQSLPVCGLGGWALGGRAYGPVDRAAAAATVRRFLELGGAFLDTAEAYGDSESILGEVLQELGARARVVLATKTQHYDAQRIRQALEASLRRLRTDHVDLYQIHLPPDDRAGMERVLDVFEVLRQEGKIRLIGASIKGPNVTAETVALCRQYLRTGRVQALQVIYSALRPGNEEMFAEAASRGVAIIARTILENGFLTGKFAPGHSFPDGDHRNRWPREQRDALLTAVAQASTVLPPGESMTEAAIRFAHTPPEVSIIIPGSKSPVQVEQNWRGGARSPLSVAEQARWRAAFGGWAAHANLPH